MPLLVDLLKHQWAGGLGLRFRDLLRRGAWRLDLSPLLDSLHPQLDDTASYVKQVTKLWSVFHVWLL